MDFQEIQQDISSFADDDQEVIIEKNGQMLFSRAGKEFDCRVVQSDSGWMIEIDDTQIPYSQFLSKRLAQLDVLAERLISKRPSVQAFIDGPAHMESNSLGLADGTAIGLIHRECSESSPFSSRVIFITADAGHGKTALLREYQLMQAKAFLGGSTKRLFWHVDLQGRQLLRLSEALLGDLGELRVSGIWMPSILTLLRHRLLVLAIDGFDELAAEQGNTDALGSLAQLVQQMGDKGTIVAASRRTFFDTEDYAKRTGMLRTTISTECEFDQIHLTDWQRKEGLAFLSKVTYEGKKIDNPDTIYAEVISELNGEDAHPLVSRPFLLAHMAKALIHYEVTPADLIRGMVNPEAGVAAIVDAFLVREVQQKWKSKDTGEPYLTKAQHMSLLAQISEEMYLAQKDRLTISLIEEITSLLLDSWKIDPERKRQVFEMVRMHVLLTIPTDTDASFRGFDHPEFRDYFLAHALAERVKSAVSAGNPQGLGAFLSKAQLTDSTARYAASLLSSQEVPVESSISLLVSAVSDDWRPTFLQTNAGTLIPFILDGYTPKNELTIDAKVSYSSLVFEGSHLSYIRFCNGTFNQTSFTGARWKNVVFSACEFSGISFDMKATYANVKIENCRVNDVRIYAGEDELRREYSPLRIQEALAAIGITVVEGSQAISPRTPVEVTEKKALVHRFLRAFRRTTALSEHLVTLKFRENRNELNDEIIPLLERYGIVQRGEWSGGGKPQVRWILKHRLEDIMRADGGEGQGGLTAFWKEVNRP